MPSLLEGIEAKYGCEENFQLEVPIFYVPRKQTNSLPPILVFNDFGIDSAGSEETLGHKCQHVQELDLAQNSLSQWSEVMTILYHMPRLQFANLSFNSLSQCLSDDHLRGCFPRLRNLILNATYVSWSSVRKLITCLPSLEELHLSLNGYRNVELDDKDCVVRNENVKKLYFTDNEVSSWEEICKLGEAFPQLHALVLADCPVRSLTPAVQRSYSRSESECEGSADFSAGQSAHHHFRSLRLLNLNNTHIHSWEDIDRLACFPSLQNLRIHGIPLLEALEDTAHERRQMLIARLPNIVTLNGGEEISKDDREDAERAFIRYFMDRAESDRPERYSDLVATHGKLDPLVNVDLSPEKNIKVILTCGHRSQLHNLNVYQTVSELKQKVEQFSGLPSTKMKLFYVDQEMKDIHGPEEMKFPNKQLYSYNISNGDEIIIDSKR